MTDRPLPIVSEWVPVDNATARKEITKRRRHFNVSKSSFISSVRADASTVNPRDMLIDESKPADIENLGDCLRVLGNGELLGEFSLTIVLCGEDKGILDRVLPDVVRIFTSADGTLFSETYNQLNAYFATGEQHVQEDLGRIPAVQDWLLPIKPQRWMFGQRLGKELPHIYIKRMPREQPNRHAERSAASIQRV
jgi:hypothetical protein